MRIMRKAAAAMLILGLPAISWGQAPSINIHGAGAALEENIRAHLRISDERCNSQERRLNRLVPSLRQNLERAAQALGYYFATFNIDFVAGEPCWTLNVEAEPGEPLVFGEVSVELRGDESAQDAFGDLLEDLPVSTGDQLNHARYERLKSRLSSLAVENGYFAARFTRSELNVDLRQRRANVNIVFEPGERYDFGSISIAPIEELSEDFIRRFLSFEENSPYSTEEMIELRQNLNDSQYFQEVIVTPQLTRAENMRIPVNIELTPRRRRAYSTGVGVSTDIGPRVRLSYEDRYINRSGHRLSGDLSVSPVQQELRMNYTIPLWDPASESLRFSGGYLSEETENFTSDTYKIETTYRSTVGNDWLQNIFVSFQQDVAEINEVEDRTDLAILGANWARTRAEDPINPQRGWRVFGQVRGATSELLSDTSFMQFFGSGKYIYPLGSAGRLLLRLQGGTTIVDNVSDLPVSIRYFAGGDQSVRGYQYETLGPLNDEREVIGGKHLLAGALEYDHEVRDGWRAAVFYDVGNAFNDLETTRFKKSLGVGIRWISPIGPIRADVARSIDDGHFRIHITMGPDL